MSKYAAYPEYRYSGVETVGVIPTNWELKRLKHLTECLDGKRVPLNSVQRGDMQGSIPYWGANKVVDYVNNWLLDEELVLLGEDGAPFFDPYKDVAFHVKGKIWPNNHVHVLRPIGKLVDAKFLTYAINCADFHLYISGSTRDKLNQSDMDNIIIRYCSMEEQTQIANFLDHETAKIDTLIEKQQQLIKLLKEKRQAVISHAVTKGLNLEARMKDSGVEWLDSIPNHWKTMELKFSAEDGYKTFTDGDWIESPYITEHGVRLLQTGNVGIGEFKEKGFRYISEESFKKLNCTEVKPGDVLICRLDGPVGRSCLAPDLGVKVITSVDNAILKTSIDFDPRFLVYLTNSEPWLRWIQDLCRVGGGFRLRISRTMLGEQRIPVPPLHEQIVIANTLDELSHSHLACIEKAAKSIELLQERRTALISAVVTGKIDVRNWKKHKVNEEEVA